VKYRIKNFTFSFQVEKMDPQDFEGNPYDEELYTTMQEVYEGESGTKLMSHIDTFHCEN